MIRIDDLEVLDRVALVAAWSEVFGTRPPRGLGQTFLRRFLAFEIQARRTGGLPKAVLAALRKREDGGATTRKSSSPGLKPGGRLLRDWNGVTHVVDVTETGFLWNGETWRSLSAIARAITGAHWSGPRFFGLTGKPHP